MGIESINNEGRVFNPSDETVNTANVSGMDSYCLLYTSPSPRDS